MLNWRDDKGPMRVNEGPSGLNRICDQWDTEAEQEEHLQGLGVGDRVDKCWSQTSGECMEPAD